MIGLLCGELRHEGVSPALILCASGVGYEVFVPARLLEQNRSGTQIVLHTIQVVRENAIELFGFASPQEKTLFHLLCKVPKIGSRTAQSVLNVLPPAQLVEALVNMDADALVRVPGIGRKTAERMLVELRGLVPAYSAGLHTEVGRTSDQEAAAALVALGFTDHEARHRVTKACAQQPELPVDEIIRRALGGM